MDSVDFTELASLMMIENYKYIYIYSVCSRNESVAQSDPLKLEAST